MAATVAMIAASMSTLVVLYLSGCLCSAGDDLAEAQWTNSYSKMAHVSTA